MLTYVAQLVGASGRVVGFEPQRVLYQMAAANVAVNGTHFTCFTRTKVQILTPEELRALCQMAAANVAVNGAGITAVYSLY